MLRGKPFLNCLNDCQVLNNDSLPWTELQLKNEVGTYFKLSWRSLRQLRTFWSDICIHFQPEDESSRFFMTFETIISLYND